MTRSCVQATAKAPILSASSRLPRPRLRHGAVTFDNQVSFKHKCSTSEPNDHKLTFKILRVLKQLIRISELTLP